MALRNILSAFGKLGILLLIAVAFGFGLLTTIVLSLRSPNIQVPDVTNQSYYDGEKLLAKAGLDISERAKRFKAGVQPGVILDQTPRAGEVVKAGQTVRVVVSREPKEGEKPPDEAIIEERREERGTEGLDQQNKNQNANANKRRNTNRNANGNANSNASANTNGNAAANTNGNSRPENANGGNATPPVNRNANSARPANTNANAARSRNSNLGAGNTNSRPRTTTPTNANRRPNP
ncbi:MAG TPA: PASTA domain-containing protein [Pyrinomonadaceae bacterium]|nr:PASTA domain-containing protein [Pyrinomonadaceae bacterium]